MQDHKFIYNFNHYLSISKYLVVQKKKVFAWKSKSLLKQSSTNLATSDNSSALKITFIHNLKKQYKLKKIVQNNAKYVFLIEMQ